MIKQKSILIFLFTIAAGTMLAGALVFRACGSETNWRTHAEFHGSPSPDLESPRELQVSSSVNEITVAWNEVIGATAYKLWSGVAGDKFVMVTTSPYTFSGLRPDTEYQIRLSSCASGMCGKEATVIQRTKKAHEFWIKSITCTSNPPPMYSIVLSWFSFSADCIRIIKDGTLIKQLEGTLTSTVVQNLLGPEIELLEVQSCLKCTETPKCEVVSRTGTHILPTCTVEAQRLR